MSEEKEVLIPEKAGLQDYRCLLFMVENEITEVAPNVTQYKMIEVMLGLSMMMHCLLQR